MKTKTLECGPHSNHTNRRWRRRLKINENRNCGENRHASKSVLLERAASVPIWHVFLYVWRVLGVTTLLLGEPSSSEPPLRPHPSDITTIVSLTVPCYLSFGSALETRDSRRAFRESTAASLCIPFIQGIGLNMRRAHHRKNKQTPTSLSFFFKSFFLLFAQI